MRNLLVPVFRARVFAAGFFFAASTAMSQPLTLSQAEEKLLAGNREIIAAKQLVEVASAGTTLAGAVPNPVLTASMSSINPSRGIGGGRLQDRQVDSILRIDQVVERGNKRDLRIAGAEAQVSASQSDLLEVRRQQRLLLHLGYFELKLALARQQILRETLKLHQQSVSATELRLKAGDVAESELVRLSVEALRAANDLRSVDAEVARARQELALLFGEEGKVADYLPVDDWPVTAPERSLAEPSPELVDTRADVRAAQARVIAAERARELARSLRTRDVSVGGQVERFPPDPGLSFGVSVSVPLFLRYNFEGEVAVAEAGLTAAMAARSRQVTIALSEVRRAQNDLRAADERRQRLNEELLPRARRALAAAEFAYQRGATSLIDLLDARRTQRALELEAAAAIADFAKARAAWIAALHIEGDSR